MNKMMQQIRDAEALALYKQQAEQAEARLAEVIEAARSVYYAAWEYRHAVEPAKFRKALDEAGEAAHPVLSAVSAMPAHQFRDGRKEEAMGEESVECLARAEAAERMGEPRNLRDYPLDGLERIAEAEDRAEAAEKGGRSLEARLANAQRGEIHLTEVANRYAEALREIADNPNDGRLQSFDELRQIARAALAEDSQ